MLALHIKRVLIFTLLAGIGIAVYLMFAPKVYQASTEILLENNRQLNDYAYISRFTNDIHTILNRGIPENPLSQIQIIGSRGVFYDALKKVAESRGTPDLMTHFHKLFLMYEVITAKGATEVNPNLNVSSNIVEVKVKAYSREDAMAIADQITFAYNEMRKAAAKASVYSAIEYLRAEVANSQKKVAEFDMKFKELSQQIGTPNMTLKIENLFSNRRDLLLQAQTAEAALNATQGELGIQENQISQIPDKILSSSMKIQNPLINEIKTQIEDQKRRRAELLTTYLEDATPVKTVDESLASLTKTLAALEKQEWEHAQDATTPNPVHQNLTQSHLSNQALVENYKNKVTSLRAQITELDHEINHLPEEDLKLVQLVRERNAEAQNYQRLKNELDDLASQPAAATSSAYVLFPAFSKKHPAAPKPLEVILIGIFGGIVLGLLYSLSVESLKLRTYNSAHFEQLTGLPVAAILPVLSAKPLKRLVKTLLDSKKRPPEGLLFIARNILSKKDTFPYLIGVTGVQSSRISVISAIQLGQAFALLGVKTLIVDFDFSKRWITKGADLSDHEGMSDLLKDHSLSLEVGDLIASGEQENLSIMPIGKNADLISLYPYSSLIEALDKMKTEADCIILSLPPCDVLADASSIGPYVNQILLSISATKTHVQNILSATSILKQAGAQEISCIFADASSKEEPFLMAPFYFSSQFSR